MNKTSTTPRSALFLLFICVALQLAAYSLLAAEQFTVLAGQDAAAPKQPQACVAGDGSVHITFGVGERVYYCRVEDSRVTEPVAAFRVPNMSLGMRRGPRIAHSGSAITITAIGGAQGKGKDGDILAYRSVDQGKTWLGPVRVNDVESSAREGLHAMTSDPQGVLWSVWLDLREKGTRLFAAKSTDQGATWSKNFLVYQSPERAICECCHPSIVGQRLDQ